MSNNDFAAILHSRASGDEMYQQSVIISKTDLHAAARMIQETTIKLRTLCYDVLNSPEAKDLHDTERELLETL